MSRRTLLLYLSSIIGASVIVGIAIAGPSLLSLSLFRSFDFILRTAIGFVAGLIGGFVATRFIADIEAITYIYRRRKGVTQ